jgi:hypothetical protein
MIRASAADGKDRASRIEAVALAQRDQDRLRFRASRFQAAFPGAASGAFLDRRVQEQLEVGIGQDDRADVPAGHHDATGRRKRSLALEQVRPQLGHRRDRGHGHVHRGRVDIGGAVDPIHEHGRQATRRVSHQLHLSGEGSQANRVRGRDPSLESQPRHRPVQQARVAEPIVDTQRGCGTDAALAG